MSCHAHFRHAREGGHPGGFVAETMINAKFQHATDLPVRLLDWVSRGTGVEAFNATMGQDKEIFNSQRRNHLYHLIVQIL